MNDKHAKRLVGQSFSNILVQFLENKQLLIVGRSKILSEIDEINVGAVLKVQWGAHSSESGSAEILAGDKYTELATKKRELEEYATTKSQEDRRRSLPDEPPHNSRARGQGRRSLPDSNSVAQ